MQKKKINRHKNNIEHSKNVTKLQTTKQSQLVISPVSVSWFVVKNGNFEHLSSFLRDGWRLERETEYLGHAIGNIKEKNDEEGIDMRKMRLGCGICSAGSCAIEDGVKCVGEVNNLCIDPGRKSGGGQMT